MTTYSLSALAEKMQGTSITLGWDALVAMNRTKVNTLLEQQYVKRFTDSGFSKPFSGSVAVTPDGLDVVVLSGIVLGPPRLSFARASLTDSYVSATMEIISGSVTYQQEDSHESVGGVVYSYEIGANQGYSVTMDIELAESKGTVSDQGKVIIDIGEGVNCTCNLVGENKANNAIGDFFREVFLAQKPEDRIYLLGMLDLSDVEELAPRSFLIRTMATEDGSLLGHDDYGDGAVVLFVNCKGNPKKSGDIPGAKAIPYLIPNDRDAEGKAIYSAALVIANRVMTDWYFQKHMEQGLGEGLLFARSADSDVRLRVLEAYRGKFSAGSFGHTFDVNDGIYTYKISIVSEHPTWFDFAPQGVAGQALRASLQEGRYTIDWRGEQEHLHTYEKVRKKFALKDPQPAFEQTLRATCSFSVGMSFAPYISYSKSQDLTEVVFLGGGTGFGCTVSSDDIDRFISDAPTAERLKKGMAKAAAKELSSCFKEMTRMTFPALNALPIRNLLFPELNALQLKDARLPGDLLLAGQIDPKETTFTLEPLLPVIKTGAQQIFTLRKFGLNGANVTWQVRGLDGTDAIGTITPEGIYTAPDTAQLEGTAVRNVITASYIDEASGKPVTASAMATVVKDGVVVTPSIHVVNLDRPAPIELKAQSLTGGPYLWTLRRGKGQLEASGATAGYEPPRDLPKGTLETVEIEVKDQGTGESAIATVLLYRGAFMLGVEPAFVPGLNPGRSVQLKAAAADDEYDPEAYKWQVVAGQGQVDSKGVFTAPENISSPVSIVKMSFASLASGFSIIQLSEQARSSNWDKLDVFEFEVEEFLPTVYANGLQQAKVIVRVRATDASGRKEYPLSQTEFDSLCLVSSDQKVPLPATGQEGVPVDRAWHYNLSSNGYRPYPRGSLLGETERAAHGPHAVQLKEFYVQCHRVENLRIAARLVSDNNQTFYSNPGAQDTNPPKVLDLKAVEPPRAGGGGGSSLVLTERKRIEPSSEANDDDYLKTLDLYYIKLLIRNLEVPIKDVQFQVGASMLRWESNTANERFHSLTGYALPGAAGEDMVHHVEEALLHRMRTQGQGNLPHPMIGSGYRVADAVLLTVQRRDNWFFDVQANRDYNKPLELTLLDIYGNRHAAKIDFAPDRHYLKIIGQS